jgi:hypothetical protein
MPTGETKAELLINSLKQFYSQSSNLDILLPIIQQKSNISLRILDWLVTNYSKKYSVNYEFYKNGQKSIFFIYLSYKNQLKAYSKKYFDPFCRRDRLTIDLKTLNENYEGSIVTTIGQLNFFRWFIENKMINYVILNVNKIDDDMNSELSDKGKNKTQKYTGLNIVNESVVISFN